jgi:putative redox protein
MSPAERAWSGGRLIGMTGDVAVIRVEHAGGRRLEVAVREHRLVVDQPAPAGEDAGPTPVELFVAGLAGCVAALGGLYLARHGLSAEGLAVVAEHEQGERPSRVTRVRLVLEPPAGLPPNRLRGLLAVASHCTVHNSLVRPPEVEITMRPPGEE